MSEISWFIEKPDPKSARRLTRAGGLWNTMIMVFKTKTMLHWVSRLAPRLYQQFQQVYEAIGTPGESEVVRNIYQRLKPMNLSKEFLEPMVRNYPSSLVVLQFEISCGATGGPQTASWMFWPRSAKFRARRDPEDLRVRKSRASTRRLLKKFL